jgi:hypothetical protein
VEPDMPAKNIDARTHVMASPPRIWPISTFAKRTMPWKCLRPP